MLRLATLGFLQSEPLNGYRLKQLLEMYMSGCICANYGAIYPLFKRMEEQQEVILSLDDVTEATHGGKVYSITPLGRSRWRQEMLSHPQESWVNARSRFVIKYFFFSHLQPQEREKLIEHRLMTCRLRLSQKQAEQTATDYYQAAVQERSLEVIESEAQWLQQLLNKHLQKSVKIPQTTIKKT